MDWLKNVHILLILRTLWVKQGTFPWLKIRGETPPSENPMISLFYKGCDELTHWKRPWCWERLKVGGEGDDRGWDGWMASLTQCTWVWASSRSWWWTGKPGLLQSMGSQRVRHDWATELNRQRLLGICFCA